MNKVGLNLQKASECYIKKNSSSHYYIYVTMALRPNADHGILIHEVSTSHATTHHNR